MTGRILAFDTKSMQGIIRGKDENKYTFSISNIKNNVKPHIGVEVDFEINNDDNAIEIYVLEESQIDRTIKDASISAQNALPAIKKSFSYIGTTLYTLAMIVLAFTPVHYIKYPDYNDWQLNIIWSIGLAVAGFFIKQLATAQK